MNPTLKTILTLFGGGSLFVIWYYFIRPPVVAFLNLRKRIESGKDELQATEEQLLARARGRCDELERENEQLANDLKEETRKVLIRDQINAEDTAYIRALRMRLRTSSIDYSDIDKEFNRT